VVEIVDHHKLGTLDTVKPIVVRNRPVGCTATIVTKMYEESKVEISPEIAGLLCSAIISDTLLFRSPTCTPLDEKTAQRLAQIAGIDPKEHAIAMFDAGSEFMNMSEDAIVYQDFKKFKSGDITFGIGQVNSMSKDDLQKVKDRLKPYISKVMDKEGMNMLFFMLTDIVEDGSLVIFCGDKAQELLENGFHKEVSDGEAYLDGVVSRKKQFLPVLLAELNRQEA
jgi:manganese-dependent inorganic pyrophosphatase